VPAAQEAQRALRDRVGGLSLRAKIALGVFLINGIVLWGAIGVFWLYQRASTEEVHTARWVANSDRLLRRIERAVPGTPSQGIDDIVSDVLAPFLHDHYELEIFKFDGSPLFTDRPARIDAATAGVGEAARTRVSALRSARVDLSNDATDVPEPVRLVTVPFTGVDGNGYVMVFIVGQSFMDEQLMLFRSALLVVGGVGSLASALAGWYVAGGAVAPFERLRRIAAALSPDPAPPSKGLDAEISGSSREVARLAQELEDARRRVAERFVAQERFLSNVSHELKTPISVILTEVQTLDLDSISPSARRFAESVEEEMGRLGRLIESFLTLSRIRDGRGLTRFRAYSVNDLVMDSVEHCRKMAEHHHVRLEPELLDGDRGIEAAVSGEPELLRTMVDNLVRNAIRFSPPAGVVRVRAELPDDASDRVTIAITDRGPGIPADRLRTIFDRFSQAPTQRQGRGHGLGLTIALGIAELHGGTIAAENSIGGGCRFAAVLPLRAVDAPVLQERAPPTSV
jgi:signal transduction histidine kinase